MRVGDMSGKELDKKLVDEARAEEMIFMKELAFSRNRPWKNAGADDD